MPHKKKAFNKGNSEKFLLLRGNSQAVNADGKTLENILVPISKNYKPGTSLLMSNIAALANLEPDDIVVQEHEDIEGVFDDASTVDHSDAAENVVENLLSDMKKLKFSGQCEKFETFSGDDDDEFDFDEAERAYDDHHKKDNSKSNDCRINQSSSDKWKMFNEKFDKVLEEYVDSEIGSLDDDLDIHGMNTGSPELLNFDTKDYIKEPHPMLEDCDKDLKEKILNYANDSGDEKIVEIVTEKAIEYDCESILSTCSNIYNHPTVIKEETTRRNRKTSEMSNDSESNINSKLLSNTCNIRKKNETPEERKERQKKFKEVKKLRRELKKQNKEAFKEEKKLQITKEQQNSAIKLL